MESNHRPFAAVRWSCDGRNPLHSAVSTISRLCRLRTRPGNYGPTAAALQAFLATERRWNRTIQAEGCSALPVLKTSTVSLDGGELAAHPERRRFRAMSCAMG
jgi:hypothetical protein